MKNYFSIIKLQIVFIIVVNSPSSFAECFGRQFPKIINALQTVYSERAQRISLFFFVDFFPTQNLHIEFIKLSLYFFGEFSLNEIQNMFPYFLSSSIFVFFLIFCIIHLYFFTFIQFLFCLFFPVPKLS